MYKSKHIQCRMSQRGISDLMLNIVLECGAVEDNPDRITISRKVLNEVELTLRTMLKTLKTKETNK